MDKRFTDGSWKQLVARLYAAYSTCGRAAPEKMTANERGIL
jgi:hypothetical protein